MKHTVKRLKVFLDTSALVAGLLSPSGAAGEIIALHKIKRIRIVISDYVLGEVRRSSFYGLNFQYHEIIPTNRDTSSIAYTNGFVN